jgi:GH18 family chitinase
MKKRVMLSTIFGVLAFVAAAQSDTSRFKVIGYYPLKSALAGARHVSFKRLTHVNLWFLNPDTLGAFTQDLSSLKRFVKKAHRKNVKVMFSIGGGSRQPQYHRLLEADRRTAFIDSLVAVALRNNADGIDVDLEGPDVDGNYEAFVVELARALRAHKKLITAAVALWYRNQLSDSALAQYDFVSVMAYDHSGPWRPQEPGAHSSYEHAMKDLEYFGMGRCVPKEKMVLGVPFYGYGFGPDLTSKTSSLNYRAIVKQHRGAQHADQWTTETGKTIYYNGLVTMRMKTLLARERGCGVMIWQIKGDAKGRKSLLRAIDEIANP